MAKHGGFPMGGMGNMQQLMKQAQRMQEKDTDPHRMKGKDPSQ